MCLIILAFSGCAQGVSPQGQAPHSLDSPENNRNMPERGGGDGGGSM
jgi:hypothetical protein